MSNPPQKAALRWDPSAVNTQSNGKRSKLHTSSTVDWLKRRHQNTANMRYLLLPNELHQHKEVRNIFEVFDEDNSGKLTLDEFYNMLRQAHIAIKMEDLQEFYAKVDDNRDEALDFTEFKNSTLSDQANYHFGRMMAKVRTEAEAQLKAKKKEKKTAQKSRRETERTEESEKQDSERVYLPRTFGNLLNYLTYENKKQNLINFVKSDNNLGDKFKKFSQLLELQMDKDIYLERFNERFQNRFNTRNTQSLSPTRIAQATAAENKKAETPKESNQRPETKSIMDEEKPKVKPKFFEELNQIAENARKEAKQEVTEELRRKDKQLSALPTMSRKDVGSINDINTHKTTRKSLFLPQPAFGRLDDEGKDHEHMTSIMHQNRTSHNDSTMENDQKGSSNYIPSTSNLRTSPQSQFFKTSVRFPRSVTHSKTSTPKRPERKLATIVGGSTRSSSLIPRAGVESYEGRNSLDQQESIMLHQKIAAFQQEQNVSQGSNRSKTGLNLGSLTKIASPQNFVPSFSDVKSPKDNQQQQIQQVASKIFETRISTLNNESQAETSQFSSLPLLSPKGSFPLMKSQRESTEGGHQAHLSTFSKNNNPRISFTIKEESPSLQGTLDQDTILSMKVIRKGSRMPTDYTSVSPMYQNTNKTKGSKPMLGDKPRAKTFLSKIVPGAEGLGRLSSPKSTTNQLVKARLLASASTADIKKDSNNHSEVKKVDLNFTVHVNTAGEKERPKGKRVYTTGKRSSLKPSIVNHAFEPLRTIGIESSKYTIPALNIDK